MDKDIKWNSHVEYITRKACKKLYSFRILRIEPGCAKPTFWRYIF